CVVREDQSANPERSPESNSLRGRRGTPPWSARYRPGRAARGGAPLLAPSLAQRILRFFVRGARAVRRPIPRPPAPSETTTAAAGELCISNAPVAFSNPPLLASERPSDRLLSPGELVRTWRGAPRQPV